MRAKLKTYISDLELKNPILIPAGPAVYGEALDTFFDIQALGAITTKTITLEPKIGNKGHKLLDYPGGYLNSIGLKNVGLKKFISEKLEFLKTVDVPLIVSIAGNTELEFIELIKALDKEDRISAIEINLSCPNVNNKHILFDSDPTQVYDLLSKLRNLTNKKLFVKLSPNIYTIVAVSISCKKAGIDALVVINTLPGMRFDLKTKTPIFENKTGGLSGSAIKPLALKLVYDISNAVDIPIIGMGGISTTDDVIEMLIAGASVVGIGSAIMKDPIVITKILSELPNKLQELGIESIDSLVKEIRRTRLWNQNQSSL
ncbi:dihydroorotate dehydrogenase (NAD+) catalytic subunit [Williamsoniiplasma luminosum]|uniref:Dihydroorotate dehydrogenase n=1 Tax=Williamsoniiplasma luminosum TaxID=214888 RepID=A0A2K8NSB9_9MOLU|nr:dihydroorotate dehydrogenase [Williamsoniiplasma luminosum]ATZ16745.1 dihydroorotate dehydrogenase (NAD+) catalytic subunit [Williamsoniiplasma luminosum]